MLLLKSAEYHEQNTMNDTTAENDTHIAMLMAMGATVEQATRVLDENDRDIDRAMAQYCNMKVPNKMSPESSSSNVAMEDGVDNRDTEIVMLVSMGATVEQANRLLDENEGDIGRAMSQFRHGRVPNEMPSQYKALRACGRSSRIRWQEDDDDQGADEPLVSPSRSPPPTPGYSSSSVGDTKENVDNLWNQEDIVNRRVTEKSTTVQTGKPMPAYTPSFSMMAISHKKNPTSLKSSADEGPNERGTFYISPPTPRAPERTYPGAEAVDNTDRTTREDEFTISGTNTYAPSIAPIAAQVVEDREEDYEILQEQLRHHEEVLRRQDEELRRVNAERQNVAVAEVIATKQKSEVLEEEPLQDGTRYDNLLFLCVVYSSFSHESFHFPVNIARRQLERWHPYMPWLPRLLPFYP